MATGAVAVADLAETVDSAGDAVLGTIPRAGKSGLTVGRAGVVGAVAIACAVEIGRKGWTRTSNGLIVLVC